MDSIIPQLLKTTANYLTARGDEIDLVLEKGARRIAIECKASAAPELERGFWRAREEISIEQTLVVGVPKFLQKCRQNADDCSNQNDAPA